MIFRIPFTDFVKIAEAKKLALKMGDATLDFSNEARSSIRTFLETVRSF